MRVHRGACVRGLSAALLGAAFAGLPFLCWAAEFYSWIDSSGTMVMTDDPSSVPPATQRSSVSVHRFLDRPSVPPSFQEQSEPSRTVGVRPQASPSQMAVVDQAKPLPIDPALLDLPKVLLESPDETVQAQYVWVPLLSPIYLGVSPVPGFWCLRTITDPGQALKDYVGQHRGQVIVGGRPWRYGPVGTPYNARSAGGHLFRWGNQTHDQVRRLQQALSGQHSRHGQPASSAGSLMAGNGHASGRR